MQYPFVTLVILAVKTKTGANKNSLYLALANRFTSITFIRPYTKARLFLNMKIYQSGERANRSYNSLELKSC